MFGDNQTVEIQFHYSENSNNAKNVDIDKVLVSNKLFLLEKVLNTLFFTKRIIKFSYCV